MNKRIFSLALVMLLFISALYAEGIERDYDLNTEMTVIGVVKDALNQRRGPLTFVFQAKEKQFLIVTAPWWYLREIDLNIKNNMHLEVIGSKLYDKEGNLYLIIYSIKDLDSQKTYILRNNDLTPMWRGMGRRNR